MFLASRVRPILAVLSVALLTACFYGHPLAGVFPTSDESQTDLTALAALAGSVAATARSGIAGISPDTVSGLQLWLKADALPVVANGSLISNWPDSSGLGNTASQGTAANMPSYQAGQSNGQPALAFDGGDLLITPAIRFNAFTMLAVFRMDVNGNTVIYEHGDDANAFSGHYLVSSNLNTTLVTRDGQRSGKVLSLFWPGTSAYRVSTQTFNLTHASNILYVDGLLQAVTNAAEVNDPVGGAPSVPMHIGSRVGPTLGMNGKIAEIILYNSVLNDATRAGVECYLSNKYGLSLSACQ